MVRHHLCPICSFLLCWKVVALQPTPKRINPKVVPPPNHFSCGPVLHLHLFELCHLHKSQVWSNSFPGLKLESESCRMPKCHHGPNFTMPKCHTFQRPYCPSLAAFGWLPLSTTSIRQPFFWYIFVARKEMGKSWLFILFTIWLFNIAMENPWKKWRFLGK